MSESDAILEIKNLTINYSVPTTGFFRRKKSLRVLDDVSFRIEKGQIFGLVGESGCGKSTLGRSVVGLIRDLEGEIRIDGENIKTARNISKKVQIVFQDPLSSLNPRRKIGWILEEPLKIHGIGNKTERLERVNRMLELVGLDKSYRDRYPHELSGGQRQRISIGSALMLSRGLIVADEPVSALDVSVQSQILNLLKDLHKRLNLSYLFISHNLNVIYYMCDKVAVMYLGRIVELADAEEIYDNPLHPYTKALLGAIPDVGNENAPYEVKLENGEVNLEQAEDGCAFFRRCPYAMDRCREKAPGSTVMRGCKGGEHIVRCFLAEE